MRVAIVSGIYPPDIGGPATHASDLTSALRERGHEVTVVSVTDRDTPEHTQSLVRFPRSWPWPRRSAAVLWWLVRHRQRYDVIYATGMGESAVPGGRLARRPVVLKFVGDPAWERSTRSGLTSASYDAFQRAAPSGLRERAMRSVRDLTARYATAVIAPSGFLAACAASWGQRDDVDVVPNGVRLPAGIDARRPRGQHGANFIYVGRLVSHKRVEMQIDALARCPGARLRIVGSGPAESDLRARVGSLSLHDRVQFLGSLGHDETLGLMSEADALLLTSSYEGLPHVVIEALACGTPVLTTAAGGTLEALHPETDSLVVNDDARSLAVAMARLRDDPELGSLLKRGARESGRSFRFEQVADQIESLLASLVAGGTRPKAVFVGKNPQSFPPTFDETRRYEVLARHLDLTSISVGKAGIRRVGRTKVVCLPNTRAALLSGLLFYTLAPVIAVWYAVREKRAVVCQSPYEAIGVIVLRSILPFARFKVQVEVHGDWAIAARLYGSRFRRLIAPFSDVAGEWALRRADRVRVVSDAMHQRVKATHFTGPVDQYVTFSDFAGFLDPPMVELPACPTALFVGALEPTKGLDVLLDAWGDVASRLPEATLRLVGAGSAEEFVRRELQTRPELSNVTAQHPVTRAELRTLIDQATCLVLPSRSEGLPRIILEAMARGRPIIASDVGGIPELVSSSTGVLVPVEDVARLADALVGVLGNRDRAEVLGRGARSHATARDPAAEYDAGVRRLATWIRSR